MEQPAGLISVLLDRTADVAIRDDAAMDLADFDEPSALDALFKVGCDETEPDMVLDSVGETIAEIFMRQPEIDRRRISSLAPAARRSFAATVEAGSAGPD